MPKQTDVLNEDFYRKVSAEYPVELREYFAQDAERLAFQARLMYVPGGTFADLGSGLGPFALGLQKMGMNAAMLDRFDYPVDLKKTDRTEEVLSRLSASGVRVVRADLLKGSLPLPDESMDRVSCIAVLEHFHHSPRRFLLEIVRILKPGGLVLLGTPNAVNLRKRVSVLLGKTNLPPVADFWKDGEPEWYGHVREPTAQELAWMARAAGLEVVESCGRNFIGKQNFGRWAALADVVLRRFPGLCSDIYVLAKKTANSN